jgi:hypothetical protein
MCLHLDAETRQLHGTAPLEKLITFQIAEKSCAFYAARNIIAVLIKSLPRILSLAT